jgi:hypothetical protein
MPYLIGSSNLFLVLKQKDAQNIRLASAEKAKRSDAYTP